MLPRNPRGTGEIAPADDQPAILLRNLSSPEDYQACLALQKETWGDTFSECVPPSLLMVSQKIGGVAAGAFDDSGRLLGFVFGLTGVRQGRLVHWSDMLAVRPEMRDRGLGRRLKHYQREQVELLGVDTMYWTYDPLVARNAHLNLNHLGARVEEYVPDMYLEDPAGALHRGLSLDRFIVAWQLRRQEEREVALLAWQVEEHATPIVHASSTFAPVVQDLPLAPVVRVEIPPDFYAVKAASLEQAVLWRQVTRRAFLFYQNHNYQVAAFSREQSSGRCFYLLICH